MTSPLNTTLHGVFLSIWGEGVFIQGKSGAGKSDLALSLIHRGHQFVADDMVQFSSKDALTNIVGCSPAVLKNKLAIRGLGILDVFELLGQTAILSEATLSYVIQLDARNPIQEEKPATSSTPWVLHGVTIPAFTLPLSAGRPNEILVECLIRYAQQNASATR